MFVGAVWFIIIPKLRSPEPVLNSTVWRKPPPIAPRRQPLNPPIPGSALAPPRATAPLAPPRRTLLPQRLRLHPFLKSGNSSRYPCLVCHAARGYLTNCDARLAGHPELMLQIGHMKLAESDEPKYVVAVGGVLGRGDAQPLQQRLLQKGLKPPVWSLLQNSRLAGRSWLQLHQHLLFPVYQCRGVVAGQLKDMTVSDRVGGTASTQKPQKMHRL